MEKILIYNNIRFHLGTAKRYYFAKINGVNWSLHRYIYSQHHGEIPEGYHIHHIDHNYLNNCIENLQALPARKHLQIHPASKETLEKWHKAGIEAAKSWHSSEEGRQWHNQHYINMKDNLYAKIQRKCINCQCDILTVKKNTNAYCSNKCKTAYRKKTGKDDIERECEKCGTLFKSHKYLGARFCSRKCRPSPNPLGSSKKKTDILKN